MIQDPHKEAIESVISYGIGGGGALTAYLMDASQIAQAIAIIIGCIVISIRLIHDAVKLYRFIKKGEE